MKPMLDEMELANLSEREEHQLKQIEQEFNQKADKEDEVYLLAFKRANR